MNKDKDSIFLHQGEICIRSKPAVITTVLGSCIAIILFSPLHATGAICHAVMPESTGEANGKKRGRYVDSALEEMLFAFHDRGISRSCLQVKLFGGAHMFSSGYAMGLADSVGGRNIQRALDLIADNNLNLTGSDVGGYEGRKLQFYPHNGAVWVKKLNRREIIETEW